MLNGGDMITYLEAHNFKSLLNFKLGFSSGLNVLIGPNGAGKTNICQALGLLSSFARDDMVEYVISLGGAGAIFTLCGSSSSNVSSSLEISCQGTIKQDVAGEECRLKYEYSGTLKRTEEGVRIPNESLTIKRMANTRHWRTIVKGDRDGDTVYVSTRYPDMLGPVAFRSLKKERRVRLELRSDSESFLISLSPYFVCFLVAQDLGLLRALNIDPHIAKRGSDIVEPLVMEADGRRLSGAIYSMAKSHPEQLEELNALFAETLPRYRELKPEVATETLTRTFSLTYKDGMKCRAYGLPDGVVKLIALVVGVLSENRDSVVIEEPENYLHPWACQWLVEYLRERFANGNCILTTHSETVLNAVLPQDIIVVTNESGVTSASRLRDKRTLAKAIDDSGFGCGYHYITGSLGGVPE
jgi:predicted ATPase